MVGNLSGWSSRWWGGGDQQVVVQALSKEPATEQ